MSFTDDLKKATKPGYTPEKTTDSGVVAPVDPKLAYETTDSTTKQLDAADLKVVGKANGEQSKPTVNPAAVKAQLSPDDASVVDMSSLLQPLGTEVAQPNEPAATEDTDETPTPEQLSPLESESSVTPEIPSATTYKVGDREFKTADELVAYANGLAKNGSVDLSQIFDPNKLIPPALEDPDPADLLFEDPKRALEIVEKRVEMRIRRELKERDDKATAETNVKATWDKFYRSNPDLQYFEEIVRDQVNRLDPKLSIEAGLAMAAKKARERVTEMQKHLVPTEVVSKRVLSAPSNAAETKPVQKPAPARPTSFADEIKGLNRKRKGA